MASSTASSILCGQQALVQIVPTSKNYKKGNQNPAVPLAPTLSLKTYPIPKALTSDRRSLENEQRSGVDVLKMSKSGKLQARRLALSPDNRSIYLTTAKIKSIRGLITRMSSSKDETKSIDLSTVDHILKGQLSKRFLSSQISDGRAEDQDVTSSSSATATTNTSVSGGLRRNSFNLVDKERKSLSIIFRPSHQDVPSSGKPSSSNNNQNKGNTNRLETVDLIVPDPQDFKLLYSTLHDLVDLYQKEKACYDPNLLFLEYQWTDLNKHRRELLSQSEWLTICNRINLPLKKQELTNMFKDMCQHQPERSAERSLSMSSTGKLLDQVRVRCMQELGLDYAHNDPLLRLWYDILESDTAPAEDCTEGPVKEKKSVELTLLSQVYAESAGHESISSVAFLDFLRSQQREYKMTLDQTMQYIAILNNLKTHQNPEGTIDKKKTVEETQLDSNDQLARDGFLAYITSDSNDAMDPNKGRVGADDMTHPLSHYWINTSHDTYIRKKNGTIKNDEQMYLSALYRGVRCLEIDVWDSIIGDPVVCASKPTGDDEPLELTKVLKIVCHFLLTHPDSYPVLMNIENHCSLEGQTKMALQLFQILGSEGLIVVPDDSESVDEADLLPSPESMRGKVIIMGKRPKYIEEGSLVIQDDYDAENDEYFADMVISAQSLEEDEESKDATNTIVIGFDSSGPIRSNDPSIVNNMVRHTPGELVFLTKQEAEKAQMVAAEAELKAAAAIDIAEKAHARAGKIIKEAGLRIEDVELLAKEVKAPTLDPKEHADLLTRGEEEGVEVQEFFGDAVNQARQQYSEADRMAYKCVKALALAQERLNKENEELEMFQSRLKKENEDHRLSNADHNQAVTTLREKREHAATAKVRVSKVRELLNECDQRCSSAENVVQTAKTEAKISEKRAADIENRASRAAAAAKTDRMQADDATQKEEELERKASDLRDLHAEVGEEEKEARNALERAAAAMEKVTEQIKLIEHSTQFRHERSNSVGHVHEHKDDNAPASGGKYVAKHAQKMHEKQLCSEALQKASAKVAEAESRRQYLRAEFEKAAHAWKRQAELASQARKQADRSLQAAEAMAEHADEEREAANLRHVAHTKATINVTTQRDQRKSLKEQLAQAEKAAKEASMLAQRAQKVADGVPEKVDEKREYSTAQLMVDEKVIKRDEALQYFRRKKLEKDEAERLVEEARRHFETTSEVLSSAMQNARKEESRANVQTSASENALVAFNEAREKQRLADHALELARLAQATAAEQEIAIRRAVEYKEKNERIAEIPVALARMTFLHFTKHRYWEKSLDLPNTHSHSFSQGVIDKMSKKDSGHRGSLRNFSMEHMCRTFPSQDGMRKRKGLNYDPIFQWALGCQLVSMNYSTFDNNILKADGRFRRNGSCGYVLKPVYLRDPSECRMEREQQWEISILSARCLPLQVSFGRKGPTTNPSSLNPFVKVVVYEGLSNGQKTAKEHRTQVIRRNGFCPIWDEKIPFSFSVQSPAMSIIVFTIWNRDDSGSEHIVASSAIPVSCMREGHRSVALFDGNNSRVGPYAHASLLVKTQRTLL